MATAALLLAACSGDTAAVVSGNPDAGGVSTDIGMPDVTADVPAVDAGMDAAVDVPPDIAPDAPFRCGSNADCTMDPTAPVCDTATGRCIGCGTAPDTCPTAQHCDGASHTCVAGCRADEGCAGDVGDGGVDAAPDGSTGAPGTTHCEPVSHACVQCLADGHCPAGMVCAGNTCVAGCTGGHGCPTGLSCCSGACVDEVINTGNCGMCDHRCTVPNATPACMNAQCAVGACTAPFADCDHVAANGCEVNTLADVANCGGCGMACTARPHTVPSCLAGTCAFACAPGFADCDGDPTNGCEVDTTSDTAHCGGCATACDLPHGTSACLTGHCAVAACEPGRADCDGVASNGCEVDIRNTVTDCGTCGHGCAAGPNAVPACAGGACVATCLMGFQDCNGVAADGCEADIRSDVANCGGCGATCAPAHATGRCSMGRCAVAACAPGFADCNGDPTDGCEVNLQSDPGHCGACGMVCTVAGGTPACTAGVCGIGMCAPGRAHCAGSGAACETDITSDPANCGGCGTACALPHATAACTGGACAVMACDTGWGDCNGVASDGCETNLTTDPVHCGTCAGVCALPHATPACLAGACAVAACDSGYADCNGAASDGCEVNLGSDPTHCGGCGTACALAHAVQACAGGRCVIASCLPGYANCTGNPADGCSVNTAGDPSNCGACGHGCVLPHVTSAGCTAGSCTVGVCQTGWGDCNGNPADGCEANLATDPANCGGCGVRPTQTCDLRDDTCSGRCEGVPGCRTAIARSLNPSTGEHFYTTSAAEAGSPGYRVENYSAYYLHAASLPGLLPFYRCLMDYGKHFYTTASNCEDLSPGHVESVMGYIATTPVCGAVALYRSWNPSNGDHFYTTSYSEHLSSLAGGYRDEGISGYVWAAPEG